MQKNIESLILFDAEAELLWEPWDFLSETSILLDAK